jgi:hypothetical protein
MPIDLPYTFTFVIVLTLTFDTKAARTLHTGAGELLPG